MKLITTLGAIGFFASTGGRLQGLSWGQVLLIMTACAAVVYISYRIEVYKDKRKRAARRKPRCSSPTANSK